MLCWTKWNEYIWSTRQWHQYIVHPKRHIFALYRVLFWYGSARCYPSGLFHWHWGNHTIVPKTAECRWGGVGVGVGVGVWQFNINMASYQYRNFHCGDKTVLRPFYHHNAISYTGETISLYGITAHINTVSHLASPTQSTTSRVHISRGVLYATGQCSPMPSLQRSCRRIDEIFVTTAPEVIKQLPIQWEKMWKWHFRLGFAPFSP